MYTYGTIEDIMEIIRIGRKGQYLNTLEKHCIRKISREKLHMNDTNIDKHNPIFDELYKIYEAPTSHTTHSSPPTQSRNINTDDTMLYTRNS
jgi:hypothetical protein